MMRGTETSCSAYLLQRGAYRAHPDSSRRASQARRRHAGRRCGLAEAQRGPTVASKLARVGARV